MNLSLPECEFDQVKEKRQLSKEYLSNWKEIAGKTGKTLCSTLWITDSPHHRLFSADENFKRYTGFYKLEDIYLNFIFSDTKIVYKCSSIKDDEFFVVNIQTMDGLKETACVARYYFDFIAVFLFV